MSLVWWRFIIARGNRAVDVCLCVWRCIIIGSLSGAAAAEEKQTVDSLTPLTVQWLTALKTSRVTYVTHVLWVGNEILRSFKQWEHPQVRQLSEAIIESRQFIGWWREIPPFAACTKTPTGVGTYATGWNGPHTFLGLWQGRADEDHHPHSKRRERRPAALPPVNEKM